MTAILTGRWYRINDCRMYVMDITEKEIVGVSSDGITERRILLEKVKSASRSKQPQTIFKKPRAQRFASTKLALD